MKITTKEKDGMLLYMAGRKIVCFCCGVYFGDGRPSSIYTPLYACESEEEAKKRAEEACEQYKEKNLWK